MPGQPRKIDGDIRRQEKIDGISSPVPWMRGDLCNLSAIRNQSFAQQEPRGEFLVMSGRPHRDTDRPSINLDLQRLFGREGVRRTGRLRTFSPPHRLSCFAVQQGELGACPVPFPVRIVFCLYEGGRWANFR